jgi:hypothetical protein
MGLEIRLHRGVLLDDEVQAHITAIMLQSMFLITIILTVLVLAHDGAGSRDLGMCIDVRMAVGMEHRECHHRHGGERGKERSSHREGGKKQNVSAL